MKHTIKTKKSLVHANYQTLIWGIVSNRNLSPKQYTMLSWKHLKHVLMTISWREFLANMLIVLIKFALNCESKLILCLMIK